AEVGKLSKIAGSSCPGPLGRSSVTVRRFRSSLDMYQPRTALYQTRTAVFALSSVFFATALVGCGREEAKYEPVPAVSGLSVSLPAVPNIAERPVKDGDAYTVWGASYYQRNRVHQNEVLDQNISIVGYITK